VSQSVRVAAVCEGSFIGLRGFDNNSFPRSSTPPRSMGEKKFQFDIDSRMDPCVDENKELYFADYKNDGKLYKFVVE
jgi:hypothetical protein